MDDCYSNYSTVSKNIMIAHGGKIGILPSLPSERGSAFFVDIPVSDIPSVVESLVPQPARAHGTEVLDHEKKKCGEDLRACQSWYQRGISQAHRFGLLSVK